MPYIKSIIDRTDLVLGNRNPKNPGELNFVLTAIIHNYIKEEGLKYTTLNEAMGVLECAKLELYRMVVSEYEDKKRLENGAISELDSVQLNDVM